MSKTTSTTRNQNDDYDDDDAFSRKRQKTAEKSGVTPWSDLNHDVLFLVMVQLGLVDFLAFSGVCKSWRSLSLPSNPNCDVLLLVMMRLGITDFVAFSGVCKSWRSFALSNWKRFMASKTPMSMWISIEANHEKYYCILKDIEGRKFKTIIPHYDGRFCVGLTCGYLVLFGDEIRDFWLVNPITRHQLHFPNFPINIDMENGFAYQVKAILVFSPSINRWVFVSLDKEKCQIWSSIVGEGAWNHVTNTSPILDCHVFKGKIYIITSGGRVYEMRLNPELKLTLLEIKNFREPHFLYPEFLSSGENLYVLNYGFLDGLQDMCMIQELDFGEMKWVMPNKTIEKYAFFASGFTDSVVIKPKACAEPRSKYERYALFLDQSKKYKLFATKMWYFPHECMNVNLIDD